MAKKIKLKQSTSLNLNLNQNSILSSATLSLSSATLSNSLFSNTTLTNTSWLATGATTSTFFSVNGTNQTPVFTVYQNGTTKAGNVVLPDDFEIMVDYFKYIIAHLNIELTYSYEDFTKMGKDGYKGMLESIIRDTKIKKLIK
jgi:hypothetical protein